MDRESGMNRGDGVGGTESMVYFAHMNSRVYKIKHMYKMDH